MSHITLNTNKTAFVSPTFVDNENTHKFSTIQAAIDYAYSKWGILADPDNPVVIKIEPGLYTEQVHTPNGYILTSCINGIDAVAEVGSPVIIYNTGLDETHYPLRSDGDEHYRMIGIKIKTDINGVIGKLPANGRFQGCMFDTGHFIECNGDSYNLFSNCNFDNSDYGCFNLTGTNLTGWRYITFQNFCKITNKVTPTFQSTHLDTAILQMKNTLLKGSIDVGGNWSFIMNTGLIYGLATRNEFNTTGIVHLINSTNANGLHFTTAPSEFVMIKTNFEGGPGVNLIPVGEADVTSDVQFLAEYFSSVNYHHGLSGNIQTNDPIKNVGGHGLDNQYINIQEAINSIGAAGTGVVNLHGSFIDLAEMTIPAGANITIDGHKRHSLTFTGDIVELTAGDQIIFYALANINGGNIEVNGNSAYVGFEETLTANAYVTLTSGTGSYCLVYNSTIKAPTGHPAIQINNTDTTIISGYSRIDGGVGHPAIKFTVQAHNKLKVKFSTLMHGDGGSNIPIQDGGVGQIDILIYASALNADWNSADFNNLILTANNTTDSQIDF